jgi:tetratricopeptide (TPR) repeat protein
LEWEASAREFRRAIDLNSGYAPAHQWYSEYLAAVGAFDESMAAIRRALELDPVSVNINADVARMLYLAGRCDEAIEQIRQTIEMEPEFWLPHHLAGQIYTQTEMYEEALAEFGTAMELSGRGPLSGILIGHAYAVAGMRSEALAAAAQLSDLWKERYFSPYRLAVIYAGLEDEVRMFEWLEVAYESRDANLIWLKVAPMLDSFRARPQFQDLMLRVGFQRCC